VIAQAYLNEWISRAPWPTQIQIEQDLVLSRLIVEIAGHELLGGELALRGGTCLNKLHLPEPLRYSEDLDYVRRTRSGIKPYLTALREVALGVGLVEHGTTQSGQMVHIVFDAQATGGPGRIRVKIETLRARLGPSARSRAFLAKRPATWPAPMAENSSIGTTDSTRIDNLSRVPARSRRPRSPSESR
jgi:hypothetical protein